MSQPDANEKRFDAVIDTLSKEKDVTSGGVMFSATGVLKVNNKVFSMLAGGRLIVKLSRARVDSLVESGEGIRFDPSGGRPMKEWLSLDPASGQDWLALSREAMVFVGGKS